MSGEARPVRRLRWYDLITPQAVGLGVSALTLLGCFFLWAHGSGQAGALDRLHGVLKDFTSLSLLLDYSNLLLLGVSLWILARVTDPALPARFGKPSARIIFFGAATGAVTVIGSSLVEYLSDRFLHTGLAQDSLAMPIIPEHASQLLLGTFTVAILAPLTEEAYFRGIVMGWFWRHGGRVWGIALSSLIFGLLHLKFWTSGGATGAVATIELILIGALLAWVASRTGSLWASFTGHAVNNFCALLASLYLTH